LMNSINSSIAPFIDGGYPFPNYIWFTSLSQLVSRICYENENIRGMITNIIINILLEYPQQSIWSLLPVANSNSDDHETRKKTALEIFKTAKNKSKSIKNYEILQILEEAQLFFDTMLEICEYKNSTKQKEFSKYEFFNMISIF
jgi:phosphatidylinositol kinase/protein kinase (PI-3  family)